MKVTYYLEIMSSWCFWSEPMWASLRARYAGRVEFEWKIALMRPEDFPASREQCDWFYRRSGMIMRSPAMLNSGWFEAGPNVSFQGADLVAEAGRDFGISDDGLRLALSHASEIEGKKVGRVEVAADVGAKAAGIPEKKLLARAKSAAVRARVDASTAEFFSHRIDQRPAYVLTDSIGDKAVFSGIVQVEPLAATIDAMLSDTAAYAAHAAHFGPPPRS
ncbi:MAG TPA: disulfide bond formation protein DsbA [Opitutaceae bacterium]|jgi:predicted DsbA family dithiol-disulfide isomerase